MDTLAADSTTTAVHSHNLTPHDSLASQSDINDALAPASFDTLSTTKNNALHTHHPITTGKLIHTMNVDGDTEALSQLEFSTTKAQKSKGHPDHDYQQQLETSDMSPAIISCKMREPAGEKHEEAATNDNISNSSSATHFTTNPSFTAHALPFSLPSSSVREAIMLHPNITQHQGSLSCRSESNSMANEGESSDTNNSPAAPADAEMNTKATKTTTGTTGTTEITEITGTEETVASSFPSGSTAASVHYDVTSENEKEDFEEGAVTYLGGENNTDHLPHSSTDTDRKAAQPSLPSSSHLAAMTTTPVTECESQSSGELEDSKTRDAPLRPSITISGETMATITSSSSSSLSEYLLIGQEQVEKEDIEGDLHSERSFGSASQDSYGDFRYHQEEEAANDGRPLSSYSNYSASSSNQSQDEYEYEDLLENPSMYRPRSPSQQQQHRPRRAKQSNLRRAQYSEDQHQESADFKQHQQRITEKVRPSSPSSVRDREGKKSAASASSTVPSASTTEEKTRKRRSYRASVNNFDELEDYDDPNHQTSRTYSSSSPLPSKTASTPATSTPILPALKIPSVRGLTKSVFEFIVASVVCLSLISCMFALSYVSTGANRLVGWYSDQKIGQRFRDGIKEREHFVQETLEKMAGEEYAKVKRQSRQYGQQQQHQQQQSRHQQQYHQERDHRYQQQQQRQEQQERGRLSPAEWQELIRAASMSFMAKFSSAPESVPGFARR